MQIFCDHCGRPVTITAKQLGGKGRCPSCRGEIELPTGAANAAVAASDAPATRRRFRWLTNSMSGLVSMVLHIGLFLFMALMSYGGHGIEGIGDDVLIGEIPSEQLSTMQEEELKPDDITRDPAKSRDVEEMVEVETPTSAAARDASSEELLAATPSPSGGDTGSFDVGTVTVGGGSMAKEWPRAIPHWTHREPPPMLAFPLRPFLRRRGTWPDRA